MDMGVDKGVDQLMHVAPPFVQIYKKYKWCHLVAKSSTDASGTTWKPNFQQCNWCHLMAKISTYARIVKEVKIVKEVIIVTEVKIVKE